MNRATLLKRSLRHYWRTHLGVLAGAIVASATLVGALVVGDSVRHSLAAQAGARVGRAASVLSSHDRFFRMELAADLGADVAPVIRIRGVATTSDGEQRVHDVQILGADARFFSFAPGPSDLGPPDDDGAYMNAELARRLGCAVGDDIVVRVEKPSALPRDMALAPDDVSIALRLRVARILGNDDFGAFSLESGAQAPATIFLSLEGLARELEVDGRANVLLARGADTDLLDRALLSAWTLSDVEVDVRDAGEGMRELVTSRIFFDAPILAALASAKDVALDGVFTYFVNEIRSGERATPYSMIAGLGALGPPAGDRPWQTILPPDSAPEDIILNSWLADDLDASVGDSIEISFWVVDASRKLVEYTHDLRVKGVVPLSGAAADRSLMPDFPGLADSESCRDWDPGTPVDLDRLRGVDEAYWSDHHGTPKAFITLDTARELWSSRFGQLTSIRFDPAAEDAVRAILREDLEPRELGLYFSGLGAGASGDSPTDFGGLFIGLSFFLIFAALLLTAQLFLFGVEQRAREIGLLAAIGFRPALIRRVFLVEGLALALVGAAAGAGLGLLYTRGVLWGLATIWSDAVSSTVLEFHATVATVLLGAGLSLAITGATIAYTLRRKLALASYRLLAGDGSGGDIAEDPGSPGSPGSTEAGARPRRWSRFIVAGGLLGALALVAMADPTSGPAAAGAFFGAGTLFLTSAIVGCRIGLQRLAARGVASGHVVRSVTALGVLGSTRRIGRSLATVALMAIGTFLVVAIGVNRLTATQDTTLRSSGTGGFALWGRSSLPLVHDLATEAGRDAFGLDASDLEGVAIVPLRLRAGDDASCLNLARAANPVILGVDPAELVQRGAFRFVSTASPDVGWDLLNQSLEDGSVPAIGDATSLQWQLHKSVGDTIEYTDERGRPFSVRIVGAVSDSILQGNLLIGESHFERLFPTDGGYRRFLLDAPEPRASEVQARLSRALSDIGLSLEGTGARLDAFHSVQNSYLKIFEALGALGLLLGSVGLGMVVLRNTLERRSELALVAALGFSRATIRRWILAEYGFLLVLGLAAGVVAALVAVLPAMRNPASDMSLTNLARLLGMIAVNGALWIGLAAWFATRRTTVGALFED